MSVYLLGSSLVMATLIPPDESARTPGRPPTDALAYLAHGESP